MPVPTSPSEHGTLIYWGAEGYTGLYVTSATFSVKYNTNEEAADEDGITRTLRQSDGRVEVSIEAMLLNGSSPPEPGEMMTYSSHTTGELTNLICMDVSERTGNKSFVTVSISATAFEGISA